MRRLVVVSGVSLRFNWSPVPLRVSARRESPVNEWPNALTLVFISFAWKMSWGMEECRATRHCSLFVRARVFVSVKCRVERHSSERFRLGRHSSVSGRHRATNSVRDGKSRVTRLCASSFSSCARLLCKLFSFLQFGPYSCNLILSCTINKNQWI